MAQTVAHTVAKPIGSVIFEKCVRDGDTCNGKEFNETYKGHIFFKYVGSTLITQYGDITGYMSVNSNTKGFKYNVGLNKLPKGQKLKHSVGTDGGFYFTNFRT